MGENARRMNLSMLSRCLMPGMDAACRMQIANGWASRHGAWAQTAIAEAIRRLEGFSPRESSNFIQVATRSTMRGATPMPVMPWAPWAPAWFAIPPPSGPATRTGLDDEGARIVRLGSFVWQLVGMGAFEQGVMSASVVAEVAFECLQLARLGRELIEHERMRSNTGVRLLSFNESIHNRGSGVSAALDKAQCCLSHFSLKDISDAFHPKKPLLERIYSELTRRTRARLGNHRTPLVPSNYETFVGDALALLLPAIEARRTRINLPCTATPHPLGDLLRTVPKCREWTPLMGKCRLELADIKAAHPDLREALEHYVKEGEGFVKAKHIKIVTDHKETYHVQRSSGSCFTVPDVICTNRGPCFTRGQESDSIKDALLRNTIPLVARAIGEHGPLPPVSEPPPPPPPPLPPPQQRKAKVEFEFESAPLLQLLKM